MNPKEKVELKLGEREEVSYRHAVTSIRHIHIKNQPLLMIMRERRPNITANITDNGKPSQGKVQRVW